MTLSIHIIYIYRLIETDASVRGFEKCKRKINQEKTSNILRNSYRAQIEHVETFPKNVEL